MSKDQFSELVREMRKHANRMTEVKCRICQRCPTAKLITEIERDANRTSV